MTDDVRLIKKYPNRRLYDTAISSYITLADVKRLVTDGVDFRVIDAKSRDDLTRTILLQIISEEEEGGEPIFSTELLAQIIRSYGGNMQNLLTSYLEKSMDMWSDQQRMFREHTREFMESNPMSVLSQIAERNLKMWQAMSGVSQSKEDGDGPSATSSGKQSPTSSPTRPGSRKR
ncbi:polyhydroxyalkanoate synthesis repressor PhaR [Natronocella acetinitrilica]|uniref:Polyhydroxyalkanoate synthesis repressor PhaR n=1 Tax=Natronocella acetinitrilica TaxID=414046 RepID=A0AAE3KAW3_9GAMM|nr:polyhydroxyalkanoate synthesis repressor PhaR [Natronocella acetinitrilica]MCP1674074.1 polyhydroxyalkanoate synthesis repressor PhaR [Natronocella acetinitrilica]